VSAALRGRDERSARDGDTYISDPLHYHLAVEAKVIETRDEGKTWVIPKMIPALRALITYADTQVQKVADLEKIRTL